MLHSHNIKIVRCKDGSDTLYSEELDQYFHNPNGAYDESLYMFFNKSGFNEGLTSKNSWTIFEVGFGTGLNLLLLADLLDKNPDYTGSVSFHSVEMSPLPLEMIKALNYAEFLTNKKHFNSLVGLFASLKPGLNTFQFSPQIEVTIFYGLFDEYSSALKSPVNLFFHDPFPPEFNAELWTAQVFAKLMGFAAEDSTLVTYGSSVKARAAMAVSGWKMAITLGALGKREMTVASNNAALLEKAGFKRVKEARLIERWESGEWG
jgi:tRNA U34 5-methylaminomethyl-2-thiouridine-forming methyltransferase MnmC